MILKLKKNRCYHHKNPIFLIAVDIGKVLVPDIESVYKERIW